MADSDPKMVVVVSDISKIIEWEELQQELACLWSLSSVLNKAEVKEALAQKIEVVIKLGP